MIYKKTWLISLIVATLLLLVIGLMMFRPSLDKIHAEIKKEYQSVSHISASDFSKMNADQVVVFDVREPDEYDVSHIEGAIQVMPSISAGEFIQEYADLLEGKHVVLYCSVGRRSSLLASRLGDKAIESGANSIANLTGGVFSWVNEERQLKSISEGDTNVIHPYNRYWGQLIQDQRKISYEIKQ